MVATTWRETSIRPRSLAWISVLGGFPVRGGLAFVFESIRVLLCDADFAPIIRDDSGAPKQTNTMAQRRASCRTGPQYGHNVSHSIVPTKRRCMPNLHKATGTNRDRLRSAIIATRGRRL